MSFESIISTDPKSQARLYASCQLMAAHLAEKGINITPADFRAQVESLPSIKLCCLMEDALDVETAEMQIRRLPGVENQARLASLKIALQARTPYAASQFDMQSPLTKMEIGRQLLAQEAAAAPKARLAPEDEARLLGLLQDVKSPSEKLTLVRNWGLCS